MKSRSDAENHRNRDISRKEEIIAICRGKCQKSRFVAVNAKYRDSAPTATNFCPCPPPPTQQRTELSDLSLEEPTTSAPHNTWTLNCRPSDTSASSTYKYYHGQSTPPTPRPSQTSTNHLTGCRLLPLRLPTLPPLTPS